MGGVPFFLFGNRDALAGAQSIDVFDLASGGDGLLRGRGLDGSLSRFRDLDRCQRGGRCQRHSHRREDTWPVFVELDSGVVFVGAGDRAVAVLSLRDTGTC